MTKSSLLQKFAGLVLVLSVPFFLSSCSVGKAGKTPSANDSSQKSAFSFDMGSDKDEGAEANSIIQKKIGNVADGLVKTVSMKKATPEDFRVIMASFVNLDDMDVTSQFGRLVSEELMTALNSRGFNVIEVRVGKNLIIEKNKGEFLLTRKVKELTTRYSANAFVVGTYSVLKGKTVFLNARLVRAADMDVFAASNESISLQEYPYFKKMLQASSIEKSNAKWYGVEDR